MYVVIILIFVICSCWTVFKKTIWLLIILVLHKWPNTHSRGLAIGLNLFHIHGFIYIHQTKKSVVWSKQPRHRRRHNERGKKLNKLSNTNRVSFMNSEMSIFTYVHFTHINPVLSWFYCFLHFQYVCIKISIPFHIYVSTPIQHAKKGFRSNVSVRTKLSFVIQYRFSIFFQTFVFVWYQRQIWIKPLAMPHIPKIDYDTLYYQWTYFHYLLIGQHTWAMTIDE